MRKKLLIIANLVVYCSVLAQKREVLLTINKQPVLVEEFKQVYEKNLDIVEDETSKSLDNYLELYINYKLKVNEAYRLKLDTISSYKKELEVYKKQLLVPYLQDKNFIDKLIKEGYDRTKIDVKASHILVKIPKHILPQDTLELYNKIKQARNRIIKGEDFEVVAKEVSEDPSVQVNSGNLGYFNAFKMVYPFENAAYSTPKGEVSKPFKTRFGYHILKVADKRISKGSFEVAHILVREKAKLEEVYTLIQKGELSFNEAAKKYSDDKVSAENGGKLKKFGTGDMVEEFENVVLQLKNENDISVPFKTQYGWHIVKLLKRYPIKSFEEMRGAIEKEVRSSSRIKLSDKAMLDRLKSEYTIKEFKEALTPFYSNKITNELVQSFTKTILVINEKKILQNEFYKFIGKRKNYSTQKLFELFKDQEILNYFKDNLVKTDADFRNIYLEYKEGLLLFELMQRKIWNEASRNKEGLEKFYEENKSKYSKDLEEIKGKVINDYQKKLEDNWIQELRGNNTVKVRKKALKKLKNFYTKS